jgi:hypothetical protein
MSSQDYFGDEPTGGSPYMGGDDFGGGYDGGSVTLTGRLSGFAAAWEAGLMICLVVVIICLMFDINIHWIFWLVTAGFAGLYCITEYRASGRPLLGYAAY